MKRINKQYSGQTLIEIALSLAIVVIVITAMSILATNALKSAQEVVRKSESTKFANAGVEAALYYKNASGFVAGSPFSDDIFTQENHPYCFNLEPVPDGNGGSVLDVDLTCANDGWVEFVSPSNGLTYDRRITITKNGNIYTVVSTVRWQDTQGWRETSVPREITRLN